MHRNRYQYENWYCYCIQDERREEKNSERRKEEVSRFSTTTIITTTGNPPVLRMSDSTSKTLFIIRRGASDIENHFVLEIRDTPYIYDVVVFTLKAVPILSTQYFLTSVLVQLMTRTPSSVVTG